MKEFLLILFLGKSVLLTPSPVTLEDSLTLVPKEPLRAVTSGAGLEIDVSHIVKIAAEEGIDRYDMRVKKLFPPYTIEAGLVSYDGKEVILTYDGSYSFNRDSTYLSLFSEKGVPTDQEFSKVRITSKNKIEDVKVYWKNYQH